MHHFTTMDQIVFGGDFSILGHGLVNFWTCIRGYPYFVVKYIATVNIEKMVHCGEMILLSQYIQSG